MRGDPNIVEFLRSQAPAVLVSVKEAKGSTPRAAGAWMLVPEATPYRTIGGGQLEYLAIDHARKMLRNKKKSETLTVPLGPEIGQCCGGRVVLQLEIVDTTLREALIDRIEAEVSARPDIYIFGAGHVGRALSSCMLLLPVRAVLVDTRQEELEIAPADTETLLSAIPEDVVRRAAPGSAFVILTHDHALDFLIAKEALERGDAAYVGMIGSQTKRATFRSWFDKMAGDSKAVEALICPIGKSGTGDKRPEVIAAFVAAEIIAAVAGVERNTYATSSNLHLTDGRISR